MKLPWRQIHLDFHTGPWIGDVGVDFDAAAFARQMKAANVTSVTVFAKCHHGHLYYATKRPERHPGLEPGLDLLRGQVDALHREGIRAPIYISVQCDEYAADNHPAWIAREADGRGVGGQPFDTTWQIMDMNSPYQEFLAEQTAEILAAFKPVDGIFFDMCWDQPSSSNFAVDAMLKKGLNPQDANDRSRHAHDVAIAYMKRFHAQVIASAPNATVYFNSRPLWNLAEEVPYLAQVEIEALPTGGWGYAYFPTNVRFARTFGKPYMGMTARFHKSWADFGGLKPAAALEYETSQMIAHGAACSVGDQLHPRGTMDPAAYALIGGVYGRVAAREPWLEDATPVTEVGLVKPALGGGVVHVNGTDEGATRLLTQLRQQFDVVLPGGDLRGYRLLVLPDAVALDAATAQRIEAWVAGGGRLIASGVSGLSADGTAVVLPSLGISVAGQSSFSLAYSRPLDGFSTGQPATEHVIYDRSVRTTPTSSKAIAQVFAPYFERGWKHFSSHFQTPPAKATGEATATLSERAGYISFPVFSGYTQHAQPYYRELLRHLIERLLPDQLLRVDGPVGVETSVMRQPASGERRQRTIVHVLWYPADRRAPNIDLIEDVVPLHDVGVSLRHPARPTSVYLAPERTPLPFEYRDGRVETRIPVVRGHAMVVIE
ncbi:MAG TPA: alpha-L-fucosidase [Planctomycetota bacterium]|nr:alpha-L-fucosidase [Planctomycetota bacterium]